MDRVLVLGAGGFIGFHLSHALRRQGVAVVALGRGAMPDWAETDPGVTWHTADLAEHDRVARAADGCSVVYHLVSGTSPAASNADPLGDIQDTVINTVALLERLRALANPPRVVFVSSGGTVYGAPTRQPVAEDAPTEPICAYGVNKLMVEKYLALNGFLHGLDHLTLRVANPFGERQVSRRQQGVVAAFARAAVMGEPLVIWGDGQVVRDYIYVGDVAEALVKAGTVDGPVHRVVNIASGRGRTLLEVADAVEAAVGRAPHRVFRDARPVDVPAITLDITRAAQTLDWRPTTPWEEALARTCRWNRTVSPRADRLKSEAI